MRPPEPAPKDTFLHDSITELSFYLGRLAIVMLEFNDRKETPMNKEILQGKWQDFKGRVREQWGELTDNDVEQINGNFDQFVGKLRARYGMAQEDAAEEVNRWLETTNAELDRTK